MINEEQEKTSGSRTSADSHTNQQEVALFPKEVPEALDRHLSPLRLLAILIGGIFLAEVVAMLVIYFLGPLPYIRLTLIDAGIMTVLIFPFLYFLSFRPLLRYLRKSQQAEDELRKTYEVLELRVLERTQELRFANSELEEEIADRKQAEEALRQSEERYRLALDAAALGTWRHDLATGIIFLDERARFHFGFESDTVTLAQVLALIHPDDVARVEHEINIALDPANSTGYYATEYRIIHPDGGIRWISVQASAYFEGEGTTRRPVQVIGLSQEITERKHAEEALRAANEELMRFNNLMVDRELRMIELKKEVNELCANANQPRRYPLEFEKVER